MENPTHFLSVVEQTRIESRAQRIYERVARAVPWEMASPSFRSELEQAAELEMWQESALLGGPPEGAIVADTERQSWGDRR